MKITNRLQFNFPSFFLYQCLLSYMKRCSNESLFFLIFFSIFKLRPDLFIFEQSVKKIRGLLLDFRRAVEKFEF
jgi:hypothetical protein